MARILKLSKWENLPPDENPSNLWHKTNTQHKLRNVFFPKGYCNCFLQEIDECKVFLFDTGVNTGVVQMCCGSALPLSQIL